MKRNGFVSLLIYFLLSIGLFFYSFTQIDLNLTLLRYPFFHAIELWFKQIGYFNRPLSTELFIVLIFLLLLSYLFCLQQAFKNRFSYKEILYFVAAIAVLFAFSYNAFSYDLFNYIFDAKIVSHYHQNPYLYKALDFPHDPMLNFMRWTHRTYPYGPLWLILTVPLSYIGLQFFLPTFFLFKALMAVSYFGTTYYIGKILEKIAPQKKLYGMVFFALNPLVIIESLISAHNDIVMMFLTVFALYLFMDKKKLQSFFMFILSIGIKFITVFLFPIFAYLSYQTKAKKPIHFENLFIQITILMIIPVIIASLRTNFQPWYILYILPFAALCSTKQYILIPSVIVSFFSLLQYAPFLLLGAWDSPVPQILMALTVVSVVLSSIITLCFSIVLKMRLLKTEL